MKPALLTFAFLTATIVASAQQKKINTEKEYIKNMCGCYQVDFEYAETFSPVKDYEYRDRYIAHGLEWAFVDEESDDEVKIQHLLVINDSTIVKHWRQDWIYENRDLLTYQRNMEWDKESLSKEEAAGTWTQKVYQVDDSPRYQGAATWVAVDGKKYWESRTAAPLPRREYTKRSDYNVMMRNNKHQVTPYGHLHEQDNAKVIRSAEKDSILAWEKGMNIYTKVEDSKCEAARKWWANNRAFWVDVRASWDEMIAEKEYINIADKVDNKHLWQRIFEMGDKYMAMETYPSAEAKKEIKETIALYLTEKPTPWTASLD